MATAAVATVQTPARGGNSGSLCAGTGTQWSCGSVLWFCVILGLAETSPQPARWIPPAWLCGVRTFARSALGDPGTSGDGCGGARSHSISQRFALTLSIKQANWVLRVLICSFS